MKYKEFRNTEEVIKYFVSLKTEYQSLIGKKFLCHDGNIVRTARSITVFSNNNIIVEDSKGFYHEFNSCHFETACYD